MKKTIVKNVVIISFFVSLIFCLTSCATYLKGTYKSTGAVAQTFTFKDNNEVTMSAFGIEADGTYVIDDGKITITYEILGFNQDWSADFEKKGSSIYINGTEFIKL